jgi:hypothetical protein
MPSTNSSIAPGTRSPSAFNSVRSTPAPTPTMFSGVRICGQERRRASVEGSVVCNGRVWVTGGATSPRGRCGEPCSLSPPKLAQLLEPANTCQGTGHRGR